MRAGDTHSGPELNSADPNAPGTLLQRRDAAKLTWRGPAMMLFAFQHVVMPLLFDAKFMAFRMLSAVPNTVFQAALYLRLRRLVPFAIAHALMDGAGVLFGVLLPLLRH